MVNRRKRKKYLLKETFQSAFIIKFCSIVLIAAIVITGLILWLTQDSTTVAIYNTKVQVKSTADFIQPIVVSVILTVTIVSAAGLILLTLFISHRIAGPIFRLKKEIDAMAKGSLKRNFSLRSKDQLKDLSESLNRMTKVLRDKHRDMAAELKALEEQIEHKGNRLEKKEKEALKERLQGLKAQIEFFHT
jgi:methyl-accepting chemotaxis protein